MVNHIIDFFFLIDIIITFNSEYINENYALVCDRKVIAINYLKGWFFIDVLSILPFDEFVETGDKKYHKLARVARIGRL